MKSGLVLVQLSLFFLLLGQAPILAQDAGPKSPLGRLEYVIEIGRHEHFVKTRSTAAKATAFVSDGCSGGLSAGWELLSAHIPAFTRAHGETPPWEECCVAHDRLYHGGGPRSGDAKASFEARRQADEELRHCVAGYGEKRKASLAASYGISEGEVVILYRAVGDIMYRAVRLGGVPCSGLPWRWGFGWPQCE
jgi:hypothetical protein